jgi:hypothetical protein
MMYVAADNNLAPYIGPDVTEMMLGYIGGNFDTRVNVVFQIDGSSNSSYGSSMFGPDTSRKILSPVVFSESIGEKNMGNPDTLSDFVNWSMAEYPANHYALIMWDHGGQFLGACSDEDSNSNGDILSMADFSNAFTTIDHKLDIIGFNACMMAGMEPAYQIRNAADYYIGSEPSEYGNLWQGTVWNYTSIFENLFTNPGMSPEALSELIVNSYSELSTQSLNDAISVSNLNFIDGLATRIDSFASYMMTTALRNDWLDIKRAQQNALQVADDNEPFYCDFYTPPRCLDKNIDFLRWTCHH